MTAMIWIIVGVVVAALAVYAFWPRHSARDEAIGQVDGERRELRRTIRARNNLPRL